MESTYGDRAHPSVAGAREMLARVVRETSARGGKVLIPAFAVGRAQEVIYDLHVLARANAIPSIPIYVDSPLAVDTTTVFEMHPEVFDRTEDLVQRVQELFRFTQLRYTREASESKALNAQPGPMVVIAASGMAEAGRILHHLAHNAGWLDAVRAGNTGAAPPVVHLVHGEPEAQNAFAAQLAAAGYGSVDAPTPHQVVPV